MADYSQEDLLRVARRVNNTKRSYLLVNPLQAKHIPVSPSRALEMMHTLGDRLAERYPAARLVVGFAETATAIGAAAASRIAPDCIYLPTTREPVPEVRDWVLFTEEHSHAVEQKLCADGLDRWVAASPQVIFVDDEISTGKTLRNMVQQLRGRLPGLENRQLAAASVLNRVSPEDQERMAQAGLEWESLLSVTGDRAEDLARQYQAEEAEPLQEVRPLALRHTELEAPPLPDPRRGVEIGLYQSRCLALARAFLARFDLSGLRRAVVLGTEECMYPALILGQALEQAGLSVRCHATTRSPIGVCSAPGYPVASGRKLPSFYQEDRTTYLYNFAPCDGLILVSDAPELRPSALAALASAWAPWGFEKLYMIQGGRHVWYI